MRCPSGLLENAPASAGGLMGRHNHWWNLGLIKEHCLSVNAQRPSPPGDVNHSPFAVPGMRVTGPTLLPVETSQLCTIESSPPSEATPTVASSLPSGLKLIG